MKTSADPIPLIVLGWHILLAQSLAGTSELVNPITFGGQCDRAAISQVGGEVARHFPLAGSSARMALEQAK